MATAKGQIGSTALIIAAWAVGLYLAFKFLPGALKGASGALGGAAAATNVALGGSYGQGGIAQYVNGGYSNGLPYANPVSVLQALNTNGLDPDSAQNLAEIYNAINYTNPDGTPFTAAQQAGLTVQADDVSNADVAAIEATDFGTIQPLATLPDSFYSVYDAGGYDDGTADGTDGSGGYIQPLNPDGSAPDGY